MRIDLGIEFVIFFLNKNRFFYRIVFYKLQALKTINGYMKICFVMYPWDKIVPGKDTTIRLIKECIECGYEVSLVTKSGVTLQKGKVLGQCQKLIPQVVGEDCVAFYDQMQFEYSTQELKTFDIIFMRADPPVDNMLLNILELIEDEVFFVNRISGLRKANNKIYAAFFDDGTDEIVPQTLITSEVPLIKKFIEENDFQKFIIKPLDGMGGKGVILLERSQLNNVSAIADFYINAEGKKKPIIVQNYIEGAEKGDIRAIVVNGEPIGAIKRIPAEGDHRSNISAGGDSVKHELTETELKLCRKLGKQLVKDGLYICGIDIINNKMVELNVMSPGGVYPHNKANNNTEIQKQIIGMIVDKYEELKR